MDERYTQYEAERSLTGAKAVLARALSELAARGMINTPEDGLKLIGDAVTEERLKHDRLAATPVEVKDVRVRLNRALNSKNRYDHMHVELGAAVEQGQHYTDVVDELFQRCRRELDKRSS
jgi:hypothetical protein